MPSVENETFPQRRGDRPETGADGQAEGLDAVPVEQGIEAYIRMIFKRQGKCCLADARHPEKDDPVIMVHEISIVTVNYNSYNFLQLLCESLGQFSTQRGELIVIDNSEFISDLIWKNLSADIQKTYDLHVVKMCRNIGHGEGLNLGADLVRSPYTMFLDVDCHFIRKGWELAFSSYMATCDVVAGRGVPEKPIRPACMFLKTEIAKKYDWRSTPGYKGHRFTPDGFDVAIKAYHEMVKDGIRFELLGSRHNSYDTLNGEEWCINKTPYVYHHWHGAHLDHRQIDFPHDNLQEDRQKLFSKIPWRRLQDIL